MYKILKKRRLSSNMTWLVIEAPLAVSYTHLDVYKRQVLKGTNSSDRIHVNSEDFVRGGQLFF